MRSYLLLLVERAVVFPRGALGSLHKCGGGTRPKTRTGGLRMDAMDLIRDKFAQDCSLETVLHLVMAHFGMGEEEARREIDDYFAIVEGMGRP